MEDLIYIILYCGMWEFDILYAIHCNAALIAKKLYPKIMVPLNLFIQKNSIEDKPIHRLTLTNDDPKPQCVDVVTEHQITTNITMIVYQIK